MVDDRVITRRTSLLREVRKADPEWDRDSKRPVAYRFSNGRERREVEGSSYEDTPTPAPVSLTAVTITGAAEVATALTATPGTWERTPTALTYQWYADAVAIDGATSIFYVLTTAEIGASVSCIESATNSSGTTAVESNDIGPVVDGYPVNTLAPAVAGTAEVGETLTATTGIWAGTPTPVITHRWLDDGVTIVGATETTLVLAAGQVGGVITYEETATNTRASVAAGSNSKGPIIYPLPVSITSITISGTPEVDTAMIATPGTWEDSPALTYQWYADDIAIGGATATTFILTSSQIGAAITCKQTATGPGGSVTETSNSLGPVTSWSGTEIQNEEIVDVDVSQYEAVRTVLESGWVPISRSGERIRFEVRSGFGWALEGTDVERSELDGYAFHILGDTEIEISYTLTILPGDTSTATWVVLGQLHNSTESGFEDLSPVLNWTLSGTRLILETRVSTDDPILSNPSPTSRYSFHPVRGQEYDIRMEMRCDPYGVDSYLNVWIDDVQVLSGTFAFGYRSDYNYWKFGAYREAAPQTLVAVFDSMRVRRALPDGDWLTESIDFASRMETPPDLARMTLIDETVRILVDGSPGNSPVWDKLDAFYGFAAATEQASLLNWKGLGFEMENGDPTPGSTATFTADVGYTGNGTQAYLNPQFSPLTAGGLYAQNSAMMAAWKQGSAAEDKTFFGCEFSGGIRTYVQPRYSDGNAYWKINSTTEDFVASSDGSGFWLVTRTGANASRLERNGTVLDTSASASSSPDQPLYFLYGGEYSAGTVQMAAIGGALTELEAQTLYDACAHYMAGL